MLSVLVLGGTKYVGLELIELLRDHKIPFHVASRREIDVVHYTKLDRKNSAEMNAFFSTHSFDVVVDFIGYSAVDAAVLHNAISVQAKKPKLILVSTIYTYGLPLELISDSIFDEDSFNASTFPISMIDRPEITYGEGKRNMEAYFAQHYDLDKQVVLRFPIILGANDYTRRTHFYIDKLAEAIRISPKSLDASANYIIAKEAAQSILNFIITEYYGTYNVSFLQISERNLMRLYCDFYQKDLDALLDAAAEETKTPFSSNFNFIVDSSKYSNIFPIEIEFKDALCRELLKVAV